MPGTVRCGALILLLACALSSPAQEGCRHTKQQLSKTAALRGGGSLEPWPFDIVHQHIELDLTLPTGIAGACTITATPRQEGLSALPLHLLAFTVDSVTDASGPLPFTHVDELLSITLPQTVSPGDTVVVTVHYGGIPATDPSGFGGFYITGGYHYNLGVAFQSIPHSYGRSMFPCVDDFMERSSYAFVVRTHNGRNAWCNGALIGETMEGDTLVRHWHLQETIPAYLASVAASTYTVVRDTFPSIGGADIPVALVALPTDTTGMKSSFINLPQAFAAFEHWCGAYRWNKVGYVLTPQGAMEHSTSIHYPRSIATGSLAREDVMAHELAHQWWGDLVTCERAEEMYINEGFAEYLSFLFLEWVYGPGRYRTTVRTNHRRMVHRAHLVDEGWWALADVPQSHTYGAHSYDKAADVLHSLRGYLGDEAFRTGMTSFLEAHAFQPVNTVMLRDHLSAVTGTDLTDFFADWILQPGWAAFEVDSFAVGAPLPDGGVEVTVHVQQKQRGPAQPYNQVPLTVSVVDAQGQRWDHPVPQPAGPGTTALTIGAPFVPAWVLLNADERLSLATTVDTDSITQPTTRVYDNADLRIQYTAVPQPFTLHMEEYWVAADEEVDESFAYVVSPDRWWRITGAIPEGTTMIGRITYDGRPTTAGSFDVGLMQDFGALPFREDSLVLLYRPDQHARWTPHPDFTVNTLNNPTDKWGRLDFTGVWPGEYTLGWRKSAVAIAEGPRMPNVWSLFPNPAGDAVTVVAREGYFPNGIIEVLDASGRAVGSHPCTTSPCTMDVRNLPPGVYTLRWLGQEGGVPVGPVVVER
jgi:aminopeptidase N